MKALKIFEIMILVGFIIFLYNSASFGAEVKQKRRVTTIDFTKSITQTIIFEEPLVIEVKRKVK
jgi:hypothetical protein